MAKRKKVRKPRPLIMPYFKFRAWDEKLFAVDSDIFTGSVRLQSKRARRLARWLTAYASWAEDQRAKKD